MPTTLFNYPCAIFLDLRPNLYAFDHMNGLYLFPIRSKAILYVIRPSEMLPSVAPCVGIPILGLELAYGFEFPMDAQ